MFLKFLAFSLLVTTGTVWGINVETKLDFQSETGEKPKLEKVYVIEKQENKKDRIGVVCSTEGCNTTKSQLEGSGSISTDVVIEVKTIDTTAKNTTTTVEDVPDVPVVVGLGGTGNSFDNLNPRPLVITNMEHDVRNGNGFVPSFGIPQVNVRIIPPRPFDVNNDRDYKNIRYNGENVPYYHHSNHPNYISPQGAWRDNQNWKASAPWYQRRNGYNYNRHPYIKPTTPSSAWTKCICHPTVGWHPTTYKPFVQQPGNQINDKLAPLV